MSRFTPVSGTDSGDYPSEPLVGVAEADQQWLQSHTIQSLQNAINAEEEAENLMASERHRRATESFQPVGEQESLPPPETFGAGPARNMFARGASSNRYSTSSQGEPAQRPASDMHDDDDDGEAFYSPQTRPVASAEDGIASDTAASHDAPSSSQRATVSPAADGQTPGDTFVSPQRQPLDAEKEHTVADAPSETPDNAFVSPQQDAIHDGGGASSSAASPSNAYFSPQRQPLDAEKEHAVTDVPSETPDNGFVSPQQDAIHNGGGASSSAASPSNAYFSPQRVALGEEPTPDLAAEEAASPGDAFVSPQRQPLEPSTNAHDEDFDANPTPPSASPAGAYFSPQRASLEPAAHQSGEAMDKSPATTPAEVFVSPQRVDLQPPPKRGDAAGVSASADDQFAAEADPADTSMSAEFFSPQLGALATTSQIEEEAEQLALNADGNDDDNDEFAVVTTYHQKVFPGDDWADVLASDEPGVRDSLVTDISNLCGVPEEAITQVELKLGSLHTRFGISHFKSQSSDDIDSKIATYSFPTLKATVDRDRRRRGVLPSSAHNSDDDADARDTSSAPGHSPRDDLLATAMYRGGARSHGESSLEHDQPDQQPDQQPGPGGDESPEREEQQEEQQEQEEEEDDDGGEPPEEAPESRRDLQYEPEVDNEPDAPPAIANAERDAEEEEKEPQEEEQEEDLQGDTAAAADPVQEEPQAPLSTDELPPQTPEKPTGAPLAAEDETPSRIADAHGDTAPRVSESPHVDRIETVEHVDSVLESPAAATDDRPRPDMDYFATRKSNTPPPKSSARPSPSPQASPNVRRGPATGPASAHRRGSSPSTATTATDAVSASGPFKPSRITSDARKTRTLPPEIVAEALPVVPWSEDDRLPPVSSSAPTLERTRRQLEGLLLVVSAAAAETSGEGGSLLRQLSPADQRVSVDYMLRRLAGELFYFNSVESLQQCGECVRRQEEAYATDPDEPLRAAKADLARLTNDGEAVSSLEGFRKAVEARESRTQTAKQRDSWLADYRAALRCAVAAFQANPKHAMTHHADFYLELTQHEYLYVALLRTAEHRRVSEPLAPADPRTWDYHHYALPYESVGGPSGRETYAIPRSSWGITGADSPRSRSGSAVRGLRRDSGIRPARSNSVTRIHPGMLPARTAEAEEEREGQAKPMSSHLARQASAPRSSSRRGSVLPSASPDGRSSSQATSRQPRGSVVSAGTSRHPAVVTAPLPEPQTMWIPPPSDTANEDGEGAPNAPEDRLPRSRRSSFVANYRAPQPQPQPQSQRRPSTIATSSPPAAAEAAAPTPRSRSGSTVARGPSSSGATPRASAAAAPPANSSRVARGRSPISRGRRSTRQETENSLIPGVPSRIVARRSGSSNPPSRSGSTQPPSRGHSTTRK